MSVASETTPAPEGGTASGPPRPLAVISKIHDPDTLSGQLGLSFRRAMVAMRKLRGREANRPGQLSYAQYSLLFGLASGCECSARELADQADLSPATVTQMLETLESAGLVKRTRSELDRRVVLSGLTERGAEVIGHRKAAMEARWQAALADFSDAELIAATRILNRLAQYFGALLDEPADP